MAEQRPGDVARVLPARADLHGPVAVLGPGLERDDLVALELQHRAGHPLARLRVVQRRHPALDGQRAGPQRQCRGFAVEGGGRGGA